MNKYDKLYSYEDFEEEFDPLVPGEKLIWSAKPKKSAYIINSCLRMMPFALVWLICDGFIATMAFSSGDLEPGMIGFMIAFFALHLMPVWIWLSQMLTASGRWENTKYYVTDKRLIIRTGFIGINFHTVYYKDLKDILLRVGPVDSLLGVGDIFIQTTHGNNSGNFAFLDIENPNDIYPRLQKIILDIQTDIEYPNDLRPKENHGYNTEYKG